MQSPVQGKCQPRIFLHQGIACFPSSWEDAALCAIILPESPTQYFREKPLRNRHVAPVQNKLQNGGISDWFTLAWYPVATPRNPGFCASYILNITDRMMDIWKKLLISYFLYSPEITWPSVFLIFFNSKEWWVVYQPFDRQIQFTGGRY